jgi:hypothetical protein
MRGGFIAPRLNAKHTPVDAFPAVSPGQVSPGAWITLEETAAPGETWVGGGTPAKNGGTLAGGTLAADDGFPARDFMLSTHRQCAETAWRQAKHPGEHDAS